jgi:hypothetical protein
MLISVIVMPGINQIDRPSNLGFPRNFMIAFSHSCTTNPAEAR